MPLKVFKLPPLAPKTVCPICPPPAEPCRCEDIDLGLVIKREEEFADDLFIEEVAAIVGILCFAYVLVQVVSNLENKQYCIAPLIILLYFSSNLF